MTTPINTFYKESAIGTFTAEVKQLNEDGFYVEFYSPTGELVTTETHPGKTQIFVENAVQRKLDNIGVLNG